MFDYLLEFLSSCLEEAIFESFTQGLHEAVTGRAARSELSSVSKHSTLTGISRAARRHLSQPYLSIAVLLLAAGLVPALRAQTADPILTSMQDELHREKELLILPGMQRPYFIEYRLEDIQQLELVANYGALTTENNSRQRVVRVTVRIGDYKSDSSSSRGDGSLALAPTDNDAATLRYALWTATDEAYKNALRAYAAKQAALKRFQTPPTADDFSPGKAITSIEPLASLDADAAAFRKRMVEASGLFASDPEVKSFAREVQFSTATFRALVVNRYTVNSEGAVLRHGYSGYAQNISVGGQAPDGMNLSRDNGSTATTTAGLEDWPAFRARVIRDLKTYNELRNAPVVDAEDYHGPVLFHGDAAADVFNRLFVPNVEADRPEMGTTARTVGAFQSSYHSRVLPEMLSVVDDPSLRTFQGKQLLGSFTVDDEGIPAQAVTIVKKGKLENYLVGRAPVKDFPESNGHGRAPVAQAAHSRAGVLVVTAAEPLSAQQMRDKLLAMAREEKRDVYEVETLGGELVPRMLYRVSPDGQRTLVRGAVFDELDQRSLRSEIVAAGNDPWVAQTFAPVPETTIVPSLLFADIAVKRATEEQQKLPYYPPPAE